MRGVCFEQYNADVRLGIANPARAFASDSMYKHIKERRNHCGLRPKRPYEHFGSLFLFVYQAKMFAAG